MVDFGCQDTDWVNGNNKNLLEGNSLLDGLVLAWTKEKVVVLGEFLVGSGS